MFSNISPLILVCKTFQNNQMQMCVYDSDSVNDDKLIVSLF